MIKNFILQDEMSDEAIPEEEEENLEEEADVLETEEKTEG
jgi:hypothetical protein